MGYQLRSGIILFMSYKYPSVCRWRMNWRQGAELDMGWGTRSSLCSEVFIGITEPFSGLLYSFSLVPLTPAPIPLYTSQVLPHISLLPSWFNFTVCGTSTISINKAKKEGVLKREWSSVLNAKKRLRRQKSVIRFIIMEVRADLRIDLRGPSSARVSPLSHTLLDPLQPFSCIMIFIHFIWTPLTWTHAVYSYLSKFRC